MPVVRVGSKHQVVIPKAVRTKLGVKPGDYVEISFRRKSAVIKRKKVADDVPYTDEPIGPKTRAAIQQALDEVEEGKVEGPFHSAEQLVAHLHQGARPTARTKERR